MTKLWRRRKFGSVIAEVTPEADRVMYGWRFTIRTPSGNTLVSAIGPEWTHQDACTAAAVQAELYRSGPPESLADLIFAVDLASSTDRQTERKRKRTH